MLTHQLVSGRKSRIARRSHPGQWGREIPLHLETLDDRILPSVSINLNGTEWTEFGPSPNFPRAGVGGTSSPGNLPSSGRLTDIATQPLPQAAGPLVIQNYARTVNYTPDPNIIYVSTAGGGVAKTLDGGTTWEHLTDRLTNAELGLPANATPEESSAFRTLAYGSVAISPTNPNIIYAGQGDEFGFSQFDQTGGRGKGLLRSEDGGATWSLIQGPQTKIGTYSFITGTEGNGVIKENAFNNVFINKIVALRNPNDPNNDLVYMSVQQQTATGLVAPPQPGEFAVTGPELWRSLDSGNTWQRVTSWLTTSQTKGGNGIGYDKIGVNNNDETPTGYNVPMTDFAVDPTQPQVVYVAIGGNGIGSTTAYSLNGIYKTESALDADPDANTKWVVAFGGTGTFVPGSKLGRIEFGVAESQPNVLYVAIANGTSAEGATLFRTQDSGINWQQYPPSQVPDFVNAQNFFNMALAISPTDHNKLFIGGNDFRAGNGPPSFRVTYTDNALHPDIFQVDFGSIAHDAANEGPHEDVHVFDFDSTGNFLVGSDGGLHRTPFPTGTGGTYQVDWESANGLPGFKIDPITGRQIPTGLNVFQVAGISIHPNRPEIMLAGTQDNGLLIFRDEADPTQPEQPYGWPSVNGGDAGRSVFDFIDPNWVYHIAPVLSYGAANYIQKSSDGGLTWQSAAGGIGNAGNRTQFYPQLEMDPSNSSRLFTGTDNLYVTTNKGGSWAPLAGKSLPFVTNIPTNPAPAFGAPTVTSIGIGRFDPNIVYVGVSDRYVQINGVWANAGPALYRIDTGFTQNPEPAWRDRSPGRQGSQLMPPYPNAPTTPAPNALSGDIQDIVVDPFDSNIVYVTASSEVWRTTDGGNTWTNLSRNLPSNLRANTIVIDPNRLSGASDDDIYVGMDIGVWRLTNPTDPTSKWVEIRYNGPVDTPEGFAMYRQGMPDARITDMVINTTTGILAVSTYGRGVWQLQIRPLVTGSVFTDTNGNGIRDFTDNNNNGVFDLGDIYTEPGFPNPPGMTVQAHINSPNGIIQASTVSRGDTNFEGFFEFRSLPNQVYYLSAGIDKSQYQQTTADRLIAEIDPNTQQPIAINRNSQFLNQNIGVFERTSIEGVKFNDINGNGVRDADEPGLEGWTIELLINAGTPQEQILATTTTDATGFYQFTNLGVIQGDIDPTDPSGERRLIVPYNVREVLQPGWEQTVAAGGNILLTSGTPSAGNDFGNFQLFSIEGLKYEDLNGNGTQDAGEPVIPNWTFRLFDSNNQPIIDPNTNQPVQAVTDAQGVYRFMDLSPFYNNAPVVYRVREVVQNGWAQTSAMPPDVAPLSGGVLPGGDFGNFRLVTVSGSVFDDTNGNGLRNAGETTPVAGGTVRLRTETGNFSLSTTVQVDGTFAFPNLQPQFVNNKLTPFVVDIIPPGGYVRTTELPSPFTITSGQSVTNVEFGLFQTVSINGYVYTDLNGNGAQDGAEVAGIPPGATLELLAADTGAVISTQQIGADGKYTVAALGPIIRSPGNTSPYRVRIVAPNGWVMTAPTLGDTTESKNIQLKSGVNVGPVTFGAFERTSIAGQIFNDINGDGVRQANETGGVPGTTITLIDPRTNQPVTGISSVTTGADGQYAFENLAPLLANNINTPYIVQVTAPNGWTLTGKSQSEVLLRSGQPNLGQDFAGFQLISISGKAYDDINANGVNDPNEPGLANWEVVLRNTSTGVITKTVSDASGNYVFADLGPGEYEVRQTLQSEWIQITTNPPNSTAASGVNVPNVEFGNFKRIVISGRVVEDLNRDGVLEDSEPGAPGWVVNLLNAAGTTIASQASKADGTYAFPSLGPGTYSVRIIPQNGWIRTTTDPDAIPALSGQDAPGTSFGVLRLGSVGGGQPGNPPGTSGRAFYYSDNNRNNVQDAWEPPLADVQVFLRDAQDRIVAQAVTDANGEFAFFDIEPGNYKVKFLFGPAGSGFVSTNPATPDGVPVTITSGSGSALNNISLALGIASLPMTIVGADKGGGPHVQVYDTLTTELRTSFFAYEQEFSGGVRVATGDLNGDGVLDYVVVPGPGRAPEIKAYNGVSNELLYSFMAYEESFTGGMFVSTGDVNGDGIADIITGTDIGGGPRVQVFDGKTQASILNFFAYESSFRGGVRVAGGDINGDKQVDIITTPAEGGGPRVTAFDPRNLAVLANFYAFDPNDRAGVYVAAGDFNNDNVDEILVGQGATQNPQVRLFTSAGVLLASNNPFPPDEFGNAFQSEVRVATTDRFGDGKLDAVVTSGPGSITRLRFLNGNLEVSDGEIRPYAPDFTGGVYVG